MSNKSETDIEYFTGIETCIEFFKPRNPLCPIVSTKGGFFQKVGFVFQISNIKYSKKLS